MSKPTLHSDVVILGAGIGGFEVLRGLKHLFKHYGLMKRITIVDEHNYFTFTPLLHEVAAGAVEPDHCTAPIRELLGTSGHQFVQAKVTAVSPQEKKVETSEGTLTYDYCVMALGSGVNFFNTPGADQFAYTVRTLPKAMQFRESLIKQLEEYPKKLSITVVGGGFTGVEVAGQLTYLRERALKRLYPETTVDVRIVEAGPSLVSVLPPKAQQKISARLKKLQVEVLLGTKVTGVEANTIMIDGKETLPSDMTVWCTGIANVAERYTDPTNCLKGRLPVTHFLNHATYPNLYGVGDVALAANKGTEQQSYPQLGEVAHRQGEYVAEHIVATMRGKTLKPFFFQSAGTLMPIGDGYAIMVRGSHVYDGWLVWWIRRTVYLFFMPGLLRKLKIMADWTLHLFSFGNIIVIDRKS